MAVTYDRSNRYIREDCFDDETILLVEERTGNAIGIIIEYYIYSIMINKGEVSCVIRKEYR